MRFSRKKESMKYCYSMSLFPLIIVQYIMRFCRVGVLKIFSELSGIVQLVMVKMRACTVKVNRFLFVYNVSYIKSQKFV